MSNIININVTGNIATSDPTQKIVCDNTNYKVVFQFDSSWDDMPIKTARFIYNDAVVDIPIDGTEVPIPRIVDATILSIGVYADNIQTSSPAIIECVQSILGKFGTPPAPTDDVYNTIIALINKMSMESGNKPYNSIPLANGEGSPGNRGEYARGDHVHPTDTTRASAASVELLRTAVQDKQDSLSFDGSYHPVNNKVATVDTVIREVAKIIAGAPEDFNTLKELSDWLSTHGTEAAKMNSDIKENANAIAAEKRRAEEEEAKIRSEISTPDYDENDPTKKSHILNRPFYEDQSKAVQYHIVMKEDTTNAGLTVQCTDTDNHTGIAYLVSDVILTRGMLIGAFAVGSCKWYENDYLPITITADHIFEETENGIWVKLTKGFSHERYILVAFNNNYQPSCVSKPLPAPGVYFTRMYHQDDPYVRSLDVSYDGIKKLDNKFIDLKNHPDFLALRNELVTLATSLTNIINGG